MLDDSLLTKMQSLSGPWEGLTKPEILISFCKCATLGDSTMSIKVHVLHRSWSQNQARGMLLQSWRMSVNPFGIAIDRTMLINFSSGSEMEIPTKLLNLPQVGITVAKEFLLEQLILSSKKFFDPIPRNINSQPL